MAELRSALDHAIDTKAICHVVENRLRKRIGLLKDHSDPTAKLHHVNIGAVDITAADADSPLDPSVRNDVIHAVQRAQECALAAAGRADKRRHDVRSELD